MTRNLRKVNILLQAIDRAGKDVEYYAVDLSLPELERTFAEIPTEGYKHVKCSGLYGTYDHALEWLKSEHVRAKPKTILWLGSSLGNFKRHEVPPFLAGFRDAIQPGDSMLIGIDSCKDADRVYHAYNDREGVTHQFILNGLKNANRILGKPQFDLEKWEVIGEYDVASGRHHAFVSPREDVVIHDVLIRQGERVRIEESYKYSREEIVELWENAALTACGVWTNATGEYGKPDLILSYLPVFRIGLTVFASSSCDLCTCVFCLSSSNSLFYSLPSPCCPSNHSCFFHLLLFPRSLRHALTKNHRPPHDIEATLLLPI